MESSLEFEFHKNIMYANKNIYIYVYILKIFQGEMTHLAFVFSCDSYCHFASTAISTPF